MLLRSYFEYPNTVPKLTKKKWIGRGISNYDIKGSVPWNLQHFDYPSQ